MSALFQLVSEFLEGNLDKLFIRSSVSYESVAVLSVNSSSLANVDNSFEVTYEASTALHRT